MVNNTALISARTCEIFKNLKRNKMTAVDFLVKGLPMIYWEDPYYSDLLEQAKEIEKQQIIDAWHNGYNNQYPMIDKQNCGQTYYNETFSR